MLPFFAKYCAFLRVHTNQRVLRKPGMFIDKLAFLGYAEKTGIKFLDCNANKRNNYEIF